MRTVDIAVLWFSLGVGLLVLQAGALLVVDFGLSMLEVIVVAIVGSALGSTLLVIAALPGTAHGVPTMVSLRPVLGVAGSYVPTAINILLLVGWAAFELLIMGFVGASLTGNAMGPWTSFALIPVFGVVVAVLAAGGPVAVVRTWLERFAIWLVLGSTAWIAFQLATRPLVWSGQLTFGGATPSSLLLGLDLVVVMPVSWWPLAADYNRFARRRRDGSRGTLVGYTLANVAFYVLGAALQVVAIREAIGGQDFIAAIGALNLGLFALLFILVDETDNAFADVYSTAVSAQNVVPRSRQLPIILGATAIAAGAAAWLQLQFGDATAALGSGYESFLFLIGGLFVPLLGVLAADHFAVRRGRYRSEEFTTRGPLLRPAAFVAWVPAALLYFALAFTWLPSLPPIGATLPSFGAAAVLYAVAAWAEDRVRTAASPD